MSEATSAARAGDLTKELEDGARRRLRHCLHRRQEHDAVKVSGIDGGLRLAIGIGYPDPAVVALGEGD